MAAPNTSGILRTKIADMKIGDYIQSFNKSGGVVGLGTGGLAEFPLTGSPNSSSWGGWFYYIKVDKGLLISDRVTMNTVSWDTLNSWNNIQGAPSTLDGISGMARSLGGGNSYADANGNSSTTDNSLGAWPTDNEWDSYIVKKDYGTGSGRDDIWHWSNIRTITQDTPMNGITGPSGYAGFYSDSASRILRGMNFGSVSTEKAIWGSKSNSSNTSTGFRPVFQYVE